MTEVKLRTNIGFAAVRIAVSGSADLLDAVREQEGFKVMPLRDHLEQGITSGALDYGPIGFAELTAPPELILFDRIGPGLCQVRPSRAWRTA